jgi:hypothetical protein
MAKIENKKQELATPQPSAVATTGMASLLMEDAGVGRENMSAKDLAIPRLTILQALSPVCVKGNPSYVKEAEVGEFYDNIHNERFNGEEGLVVIPVTYRRTMLEWKTRKAGGGFVADHGIDDALMALAERDEETKRMMLPNGNELVETAEYYCIFINPITKLPMQAVISMAKTQFKEAKRWNSMISSLMIPRPDGKGVFNPAIFYKSYKLTSVPQSNDQGSWFGWKVETYKDTLELEGGSDLYLGSRSFRESVVAGDVKVAEHTDEAAAFAGTTIDSEEI